MEAFSGGVNNGGSGNFSSTVCVITSESAIHLSSSFTIGTLPSGLILRNLHKTRVSRLQKLKYRKGNTVAYDYHSGLLARSINLRL